MSAIAEILQKQSFSLNNIITLLQSNGEDEKILFEASKRIKLQHVEDKVYLRGLIELSNICRKDCFYCGIRNSNSQITRYSLTDDEILAASRYAMDKHFGSIVIQSGENNSPAFVERIEQLLKDIAMMSDSKLRVTLSLGEQTRETYLRWFNAGAQRYLLRIESSNRELYQKLHPNNNNHSFDTRMNCLLTLKEIGYQLGTGVMIGLPFQTINDLANDLLFMQQLDIHMVGMGPFIEHAETPLYQYKETLPSLEDRFSLTLRMIATLRIMMKDINIASTTALQAIDKLGREKALRIGANVMMPNITPGKYRNDYKLYDNKPCTDDSADDCVNCMEVRVALSEGQIAWDEWGDSKHFKQS